MTNQPDSSPPRFTIHHESGLTVFTPPASTARVLMVPFATSASLIHTTLELGENQHHCWGVKEMLQHGITVAVADVPTRRLLGRYLGLDWPIRSFGDFDMIYCNHNQLLRAPLEALLRRHKTPLVSLVYAGEVLPFSRLHFGILGMTPHAVSRFAGHSTTRVRLAPWGIDPQSRLHQPIKSSGRNFISTGVTGRDFDTMFRAFHGSPHQGTVFARGLSLTAPSNVRVASSVLSPWQLREEYADACAGLVILPRDDPKRTAVGWTNILELLAIGLPIIKTRTGPLDDLVDLEAIGAGVLVEPGDAEGLRHAMDTLTRDAALCASMGEHGQRYVREHLTMSQFAAPLITFVHQAQDRSLRNN